MLALLTLLALMAAVFVPAMRMAQRAGGSSLETLVRERRAGAPALDDLLGVTIPHGMRLEEYVRAGIEDLRIMLIQHARRRDGA